MPILNNFKTQFFNNATENSNGLMSPEDKVKLDNIKLEDIEYILEGIDELKEYLENKE